MAARLAIEILLVLFIIATSALTVYVIMQARSRMARAEKRYRAALAEHEKEMIEWDKRQKQHAGGQHTTGGNS